MGRFEALISVLSLHHVPDSLGLSGGDHAGAWSGCNLLYSEHKYSNIRVDMLSVAPGN